MSTDPKPLNAFRFGQEEQGIDGGGLFKEWLTSLSKEVFDTNRGLWLATDQNELYPNPHAYAKEPDQLEWYTFIGRMLGKALYEGLLMNVSFAGFFLAKWLGRQSYLDDLASLDYDLYKGLIALKNYPGDPEDMSLTFTLDQEEFGQTKSVELKRNGSNISVNRANRMECQ
jgi:ubiquitin-protein ligase E3 C